MKKKNEAKKVSGLLVNAEEYFIMRNVVESQSADIKALKKDVKLLFNLYNEKSRL
jgi:hypothetical protein